MTDLLDHPIIGERYFFPRPGSLDDPWFVHAGGERLACYHNASAGGSAVLHFHGNGEVVADWVGGFDQGLAAAGIATYFGEYRGYGASTGRPALGAMLDDALAIADASGVDPSKLVVYGRSVGSIYALHVAANRPVAGLVIESGIADVLERLALRIRPDELGATEAQVQSAIAARLDHRAKMQATTCPVLVLHARGDDLVPPIHAETLAGWAGDRAELILFDRGDHNTIHWFNGEAIRERLIRFVQAATR